MLCICITLLRLLQAVQHAWHVIFLPVNLQFCLGPPTNMHTNIILAFEWSGRPGLPAWYRNSVYVHAHMHYPSHTLIKSWTVWPSWIWYDYDAIRCCLIVILPVTYTRYSNFVGMQSQEIIAKLAVVRIGFWTDFWFSFFLTALY